MLWETFWKLNNLYNWILHLLKKTNNFHQSKQIGMLAPCSLTCMIEVGYRYITNNITNYIKQYCSLFRKYKRCFESLPNVVISKENTLDIDQFNKNEQKIKNYLFYQQLLETKYDISKLVKKHFNMV